MSEAELLVRGGYVALPDRMARADLLVAGGRIAAVAPGLEAEADAVLEASGLVVLPGAVDAAVRFLPASAETKGPLEIAAPFAAGGGTLYADLPGGRNLPVFDPEGFERKKALLLARSRTDFALWAAISGSASHLGKMEALRECGVVGFHAALAPAERDGPPPVTAPLLARAMKEAARLGLPVHIHPEAGVSELPVWRDGNGGSPSGYRAFLESRPARAEEEAVRIALDLAGETGCALLLGPLTLPASLARVEAARQQHGVRAATAAAAHHLLFSEEDGAAAARSPLGERIVRARPLPPLRPEAERAALFEAARAHRIDLLLSGHAEGHGMRTAQHAFPALLGRPDLAPETGPSPERARLARHCGAEAAAFLGIAGRKGSIAVGKDADLCFLDLEEAVRAEAASLLYGERESLYANQVVGGRVVRVLQRGRTLFANGRMAKVVKGGEVCFIPREGNPG